MGIPYYFYNLSKKYNCITSTSSKECDVLYFDYNSLLHPYTYEYIQNNPDTWTISQTINHCLEYTLEVIKLVKPKHTVLVVDGVAPRAKMKQQRSRRYKSCFVKKPSEWDSNQITPGTVYMETLSEILKEWLAKQSNITISSWTDPGEGEHKIFKMIYDNNLQDKSIYIYGLDADLIMISLLHTDIPNITLFRDNTQGDERYLYVNINLLGRILCLELDTPPKRESMMEKDVQKIKDYPINVNLIQDYILICCLLGNDFLEPIPTLLIRESGLDLLLDTYKSYYHKNHKFLTSRRDNSIVIDYKSLGYMLYGLTRREEDVFRRMYLKDVYINNAEKDDYNKLLENKDITVYTDKYFLVSENAELNYKSRYNTFFHIQDSKKVCRDYLDGLNWVMNYYLFHNHNNWTWYYKFHASPFLSDIVETCKTHKFEPFRASECVSYLEQLFLVLPESSLLKLAPERYKAKLLSLLNHPSIQEYFPKHLLLDLIRKNALWKATLLIQDIPDNLLLLLSE